MKFSSNPHNSNENLPFYFYNKFQEADWIGLVARKENKMTPNISIISFIRSVKTPIIIVSFQQAYLSIRNNTPNS